MSLLKKIYTRDTTQEWLAENNDFLREVNNIYTARVYHEARGYLLNNFNQFYSRDAMEFFENIVEFTTLLGYFVEQEMSPVITSEQLEADEKLRILNESLVDKVSRAGQNLVTKARDALDPVNSKMANAALIKAQKAAREKGEEDRLAALGATGRFKESAGKAWEGTKEFGSNVKQSIAKGVEDANEGLKSAGKAALDTVRDKPLYVAGGAALAAGGALAAKKLMDRKRAKAGK